MIMVNEVNVVKIAGLVQCDENDGLSDCGQCGQNDGFGGFS